MAIILRGKMWHCDITAPDGRRVRCSAGTEDKRQAQEYHDTLKAQLWRTHRLGEAPAKTFDEACLRWLNEKSDKDRRTKGFHCVARRVKCHTDANEMSYRVAPQHDKFNELVMTI